MKRSTKKTTLLRSITLLMMLSLTFYTYALDLKWTGAANDNAFFNEANWMIVGANSVPSAGTIDPNIAVNCNLFIENASAIGGGSGIAGNLIMGTGNISIKKSKLTFQSGFGINMGSVNNVLMMDSAVVSTHSLQNATTSLSGTTQLYLMSSTPFDLNTTINMTTMDVWIYMPQQSLNPAKVNIIPRIKYNGAALVDITPASSLTNARIAVYNNGTAIQPYNTNMTPLAIYDGQFCTGDSANIIIRKVQIGNAIRNSMNNRISSFILKKGNMVTFADNEDGTGISKLYIASESDLVVNVMPEVLENCVSYIRVIPWQWNTKKGVGGNFTATPKLATLKSNWYYSWGANYWSNDTIQYAPMGWGKSSLDTQTERNDVSYKAKVTHVMGFNEPDDCGAQSGQYGNLCNVDTAILWSRYNQSIGFRTVGPSGRENAISGNNGWVNQYMDLATQKDIRVDAIGMHWYDWGSDPVNSPNASAANIFNRFKNKVESVFATFNMPIWITEFNANIYRARATQDAFLALALPWLEAQPYIERYCYFQPSSGTGDYFDANGVITSTGILYRDFVSSPAIPESYVNFYGSNLQAKLAKDAQIANSIGTTVDIKENTINGFYSKQNNAIAIFDKDMEIEYHLLNLQGVVVRIFQADSVNSVADLPRGVYILTAKSKTAKKIMIN